MKTEEVTRRVLTSTELMRSIDMMEFVAQFNVSSKPVDDVDLSEDEVFLALMND